MSRLREIEDGSFYFSILSNEMSMFGKENSNRKEREICEDPCMLLKFFEDKKITMPKASSHLQRKQYQIKDSHTHRFK